MSYQPGAVSFDLVRQSCLSCGHRRDPSHRFCPNCGAPDNIATDSTAPAPARETTNDMREAASGPGPTAGKHRSTDRGASGPIGGWERSGRGLTAAVLGVMIGLVVSGAIVWFFLVDRDSSEVAAASSEASVGVEALPGTGEDDDRDTQETLSIAPSSEPALDGDPQSGPARDTSTTADSDSTVSVASSDTSTDTSSDTSTDTSTDEATSTSADGDEETDGVDGTSCPETASVDNRTLRSESVLVEAWSGGQIDVILCQGDDGTLTYYGYSDNGTIYLDARRSEDGFTAQNGDTSYVLRDGLLSIGFPSETLTFQLERIS